MLSAGKMEERNKKINQVWDMIQSVKTLTLKYDIVS